MSDGMMKQATDRLGMASDSLSRAASGVSSMLNAAGMSNAASAANSAAQQTHQASQSTTKVAMRAQDVNDLLEYVSNSIIPALEDKFAPPLAEMEGFAIELRGMQDDNWRGEGADAYKECVNLQVKASSELSTNILAVAKVLREHKDATIAYNHALFIALLEAAGTILVGVIQVAAGVTVFSGVATVVAGIGICVALITSAFNAYDTNSSKLVSQLNDLKSVKSNGGSTVFPGHWPSRGELYSED